MTTFKEKLVSGAWLILGNLIYDGSPLQPYVVAATDSILARARLRNIFFIDSFLISAEE